MKENRELRSRTMNIGKLNMAWQPKSVRKLRAIFEQLITSEKILDHHFKLYINSRKVKNVESKIII